MLLELVIICYLINEFVRVLKNIRIYHTLKHIIPVTLPHPSFINKIIISRVEVTSFPTTITPLH